MTGEYEYMAVDMPAGKLAKNYDRKVTEALNQVAEYGWRFVGVTDAVIIFERPKQG
jgi:hypothetical protein